MPGSRRHRSRQTPEQLAKTRQNHILLLSLLVALVYASALGGDFVWSDREDILQGAHRLTSLSDVPLALSSSRQAYRERDTGVAVDPAAGTWQPLTLLSNSISWGLWADCAFCFHLENVLLHGLLVVGLYALGRHLLSQRRHGNRIAAWAAALFAVHPVNVSTVAWIGGRPYLLAAVLSVWSLVIFTRLQATSKSNHGHTRRWLAAMGLVTLAAMLADETAYILPLPALLIAAYESRERGRDALAGISPARLKGLALVMMIPLLLIGYRSLVLGGLHFGAEYPTESAVNNVGSALRHLWYLIEQAMLPSEPIISDAWPITVRWGSTEVAALLGFLLIIGATGLGLKLRHPSAFGVTWFLLWLIPGVGIFASDHYHNSQTLYLAVWGLAFAVSYGLFLLWRPIGRQLVAGSEVVIFVPVILVLGVITGFSNARWWSHTGLFESEIASDPHYMEGRLELAKAALDQNDAPTALNHSLAAIEASKDQTFTGYWSPAEAYYLLGRAQADMGLYADAAGSFSTVLEIRPEDANARYRLGVTQLLQQEFVAAETSLRRAIESRQSFMEAEADLGAALAGQRRFVEAYPLLAEAIKQGYGNARRHRALAITLIDARRFQDAAKQLELSLALREEADERARLAWVLWQLGEMESARAHLDMALQMQEESSPYVLSVQEQLQQTPTPMQDDGD
jgi:Flp pilus assembly protein TadD